MAEPSDHVDHLFMQLVLSLQMGAWQQLGKIVSPITGKVERDLTMAKLSIDMLSMIQQKTEGNLSAEEKRVIDRVLYELRLNYVDESSKGETASAAGGAPADSPTEPSAQPGPPEEGDAGEPEKP